MGKSSAFKPEQDVVHGTGGAARRIGRAEQSVRNYCESGRLKAMRTSSGRWLILESEIDRFIREESAG